MSTKNMSTALFRAVDAFSEFVYVFYEFTGTVRKRAGP